MNRKPPINEWNSIQSKVDQVLGEDFWQDISEMIPVLGPRIDLYETKQEVVAVVELPGLVSTEEIKLTLNGSYLTISGVVPCDYPNADQGILQGERFFGSFRRKLSLPNLVYRDIKARYSKGLLIIHLMKTDVIQEKNIEIDLDES